jgi:methionine aminopeptidase
LIVRKSTSELEAMREGGRITAACLEMLEENIRPGVTTRELDRLAEEFIYDRGGKPEFKGYQGFPASICASPNAMIVHGIPGSYRLKNGDIISLDVGVRYEGFVTDSATTVPVGHVHEDVVGLARDHEGMSGRGYGSDALWQKAWRRGPCHTGPRRVARLRGHKGPGLPRGRPPDA